jgi:hypothetical protein
MEIMVVIGLLSLLAAAAMVASIREERRKTNRKPALKVPQRPHRVMHEFSMVRLSDAFEPELAVLWEPQIEILTRIGDAGLDGLEYELLRPFYEELVRKYPELYEGSDLEGWLGAMESAELVQWSGSKVRLTATATGFLRSRLPVTV